MNGRRPTLVIDGFRCCLRKNLFEGINRFRIVFRRALQGSEQLDIPPTHEE